MLLKSILNFLGIGPSIAPSMEDALVSSLEEELAKDAEPVTFTYEQCMEQALNDLEVLKANHGRLPPGSIVDASEGWKVDLVELKAAWKRMNRK